jgi:Beta-lactamase
VTSPLQIVVSLALAQPDVARLDRAPFEVSWDDVMARFVARTGDEVRPTTRPTSELLDGTAPHCYTPGSSGVGPIRSLVALADAVMADATTGAGRLLSQPTAQTLIAPHRIGLQDKTLGNDLTWGLGFAVDRRAFAPRLSDRTFGHVGMDSSCVVFADPAAHVAAGMVFDRQAGSYDGLVRHGAVAGALLSDLAAVGAPQ